MQNLRQRINDAFKEFLISYFNNCSVSAYKAGKLEDMALYAEASNRLVRLRSDAQIRRMEQGMGVNRG